MSYESLPMLNAALNGISTLLLVSGYVAIRSRHVRTHRALMLAALATSGLFLVSYLVYHYRVGEVSTRGMTYVPAWLRNVYRLVLFPHIVLAAVMVPMIAIALWRALHRQWKRHRRIATPTYWVWLYVSVTGVLIYWMLYHLFPGMKP